MFIAVKDKLYHPLYRADLVGALPPGAAKETYTGHP